MAIGPDIEPYPDTIETALRERMTQILGGEAAANFFRNLPDVDHLSRRAKLIAKQARVLELLQDAGQPAPIHPIETSPAEAELLDISDRIHHAPETAAEETGLNHVMSKYLDKLSGREGVAVELELGSDDRDPVVVAIMESNTPFDPRTNIDETLVMLQRRYDGADNMTIGQEFGISNGAVNARMNTLLRRTRRSDIDFAALLRERVAQARNGETVTYEKRAGGRLDLLDGSVRHEVETKPAGQEQPDETILDSRALKYLQKIDEENLTDETRIPIEHADVIATVLTELYSSQNDRMNPEFEAAFLAEYLRGKSIRDLAAEFDKPVASINQKLWATKQKIKTVLFGKDVNIMRLVEEHLGAPDTETELPADVAVEPLQPAEIAVETPVETAEQAEQAELTVEEKRLESLGIITEYITHHYSEGATRSMNLLLDPNAIVINNLDVAISRNILKALLNNQFGQSLLHGGNKAVGYGLRRLSGTELRASEKPGAMGELFPGQAKKDYHEYQVTDAVRQLVDYQVASKAEQQTTKQNELLATVRRSEITDVQHVDIYRVATAQIEIENFELEASLNGMFARAMSNGLMNASQAEWLQGRIMGSEDHETIVAGRTSTLQYLTDLAATYGTSHVIGDKTVKGLLGMFTRSRRTINEMKATVARVNPADRHNIYRDVAPEKVPLLVAGGIDAVLKNATLARRR